jgi:hypothetical protein
MVTGCGYRSKAIEDLTLRDGDLGGAERAGVLGLLDRGTDDGNAVGVGGDGGVDERGIVDVTEAVEGSWHSGETSMRHPRERRGPCRRDGKFCAHCELRHTPTHGPVRPWCERWRGIGSWGGHR